MPVSTSAIEVTVAPAVEDPREVPQATHPLPEPEPEPEPKPEPEPPLTAAETQAIGDQVYLAVQQALASDAHRAGKITGMLMQEHTAPMLRQLLSSEVELAAAVRDGKRELSATNICYEQQLRSIPDPR